MCSVAATRLGSPVPEMQALFIMRTKADYREIYINKQPAVCDMSKLQHHKQTNKKLLSHYSLLYCEWTAMTAEQGKIEDQSAVFSFHL